MGSMLWGERLNQALCSHLLVPLFVHETTFHFSHHVFFNKTWGSGHSMFASYILLPNNKEIHLALGFSHFNSFFTFRLKSVQQEKPVYMCCLECN